MIDEERAHFGTKSFFYLKDRGEEDKAFSSNDDVDESAPDAEAVIHGFEDDDGIAAMLSEDDEDE